MTARAILRRFGLADTKLPGNYKVILEAMDLLAGKHPECWHSAAAIARQAQCCERTVRSCIAAMRSLGVVDVIVDYGKATRRRIVLLWKKGLDFFASVPANVDVQVTATISPEIGPPPDPPIVEPEGNTEMESGGEQTPPPGIVEASAPEETLPTPEATPEQAAKLVEDAAKLFPTQAPRLVAELTKKWATDWIRAALKRAVQKRERGDEVVPGYVVNTLKGFKAEGGPPADLTAPERGQDEVMRLFMEAFERA